MTLQELLKEADYRETAKEHLKNYEFLTTERYGYTQETCEAVLKKFADMLCSLTPKPSKDIMLAVPCFEDGKWSTEANLYIKEEFAEKFKEYNGKTEIDIKAIPSEEAIEITKAIYECMPQSYGYEFSEWEEILGAEVYPENYEKIGKEGFVSAVLFELSFNGMTRESQEERRKELDESIREAEEIKKLQEYTKSL